MMRENLKQVQKRLFLQTDPEQFFEPVWGLLGSGIWVAGGSVNRWLEGKPKNSADFDLFSNFQGPAYAKVKEKIKLAGGDDLRESHLAWTFTTAKGATVQLIKRPYESLEKVLGSFDFTARMVGTDGTDLVMHADALGDIKRKRISHYPGDFSITVTSLYGLLRYANRGYTLDHTQAKKFMRTWGVPEEHTTSGYEGGLQ